MSVIDFLTPEERIESLISSYKCLKRIALNCNKDEDIHKSLANVEAFFVKNNIPIPQDISMDPINPKEAE